MENWKDIPGYEGRYVISDRGRVVSFCGEHPLELRPGRTSTGHLTVALGRGNSQLVHRLVMLAFVGPCEKGFEVLHRNGDPADNRLENLRYGSRSENNLDIAQHGRRKLSLFDVEAIKYSKRTHGSGKALAQKYGVAESTISAIRKGAIYPYV